MNNQEVEFPLPRRRPQPITLDQFMAYTPAKFELVQGYLFDGPDSPSERVDLLALLLTNCGLNAAVALADEQDWRDAIDDYFSNL